MLHDLLLVLAGLGSATLWPVWMPLLAWTIIAGGALLLDDRLTLRRPDLRHRLLIVLLVALPMGVVLSALSPVEIPIQTMAPVGIKGDSPAWAPSPPFEPLVADRSLSELPTLVSATPAASPAPDLPSPPHLLVALGGLTVVLIGASILGLLHALVRQIGVRRWIARLRVCPSSETRDAQRMTTRLGVDTPITFVQDEVTPFTWGIFQPRIVLPLSLADDPDALRMALAHESAHARSYDPAWDAAARLTCALIPWHPAARLLVSHAALRREQAADACVLSTQPAERASYARLLMRYAIAPVPVALAAPLNHLTPRVHAMTLRLVSSPRSLPVALLVLLTLTVGLSVRAQDTNPSLVSGQENLVVEAKIGDPESADFERDATPQPGIPQATGRALRIVGSTQSPRGLVGQVLDADSGDPVAGASVRVGTSDARATSDAQGRFFLALADLSQPGTVIVSAPGYARPTSLDLTGLLNAGDGIGRLMTFATSEERNDVLSTDWEDRYNPLVSFRMGLSESHHAIDIELVDSDCPELNDAAYAAAQARVLRSEVGEVKQGEYAYALIGCGNLRGETVGAWASPVPDDSRHLEFTIEWSKTMGESSPNVAFTSPVSDDGRYTSPRVLRSDCPAQRRCCTGLYH